MSSTLQNQAIIQLVGLTPARLANLCGILHENIKLIQEKLQVFVKVCENQVIISNHGAEGNLLKAKHVIKQIYSLSQHPVSKETILHLINDEEKHYPMNEPVKLARKNILPKNSKQAAYIDSIGKHDITFAVGPAGTGKTYLAVSKAIESFEKGEAQKLIFVRPAVEAGEKLGFLPGDLVEKVLPYLRPVYDALYEMIGVKETQKLIQSDIIEILPLAFMRGRTLNESFIILDEAQNTTIPQMKMFLTRMGFSSRAVITGDITQIDLPKGTPSGLTHAVKLLADIEAISIHHFTSKEVVRHPLVSQIIDYYDADLRGKK